MPKEKRLTIDGRREYLRLIQGRYRKARKLERGRMLDQMEDITGLHRKTLIRLMSGTLERKPRRRKRQ